MATVKKGKETTKRRRTKADSAAPQPGAEKQTAEAQQSNGSHKSVESAAEPRREEPATRPAVQPAPAEPAIETAEWPLPSKQTAEPVVSGPAAELPADSVGFDSTRGGPALEAPPNSQAPVEPDIEEVRARAYQIFLARGGTHGNDLEDWLAAERQLRDEAYAN